MVIVLILYVSLRVTANVDSWMNDFGSAMNGLCTEIITQVPISKKREELKVLAKHPTVGAQSVFTPYILLCTVL